jgi:hypothetical protein
MLIAIDSTSAVGQQSAHATERHHHGVPFNFARRLLAEGPAPTPVPRSSPPRAVAPDDHENRPLPPPPDKTTGPRNVDSSGSPTGGPLPGDPSRQPPRATDAPVTPPAADGRDQPDKRARSDGKNPPAAEPRKTQSPRKIEKRESAPARERALPLPETTRTPWGDGPSGVR